MAFRQRSSFFKGIGSQTLMQYWLLKSEPDVWSLDQQIKAGKKGILGTELEIIKLQII